VAKGDAAGPQRAELVPAGRKAELVQWIEHSLDRIIELGTVPTGNVLEEADRRGLVVAGKRGRDAGARLRSLRGNDLTALDAMARSYIRTYTRLSGAQGFLTGLGGAVTLPVTVPTDVAAFLVWIVRVNSAVMQTYGFDSETEEGRALLRLGLAAGLGVNNLSVMGTKVLVDGLARQAMTSTYQDAVLAATGKAIAKKVGVTLYRRHAAKVVPVLGGGINAAVSGGLVYGFGRGAMQHYRDVLIASDEPLLFT
jgi:hypothetical protein